jgi:hypothetical protein
MHKVHEHPRRGSELAPRSGTVFGRRLSWKAVCWLSFIKPPGVLRAVDAAPPVGLWSTRQPLRQTAWGAVAVRLMKTPSL